MRLSVVSTLFFCFFASALAEKPGVLEGSILVGPQLVERKMRFNLYPDLRRDEPPQPTYSEEAELANVVLHLIDTRGQLARVSQPPAKRTMEQRRWDDPNVRYPDGNAFEVQVTHRFDVLDWLQ